MSHPTQQQSDATAHGCDLAQEGLCHYHGGWVTTRTSEQSEYEGSVRVRLALCEDEG